LNIKNLGGGIKNMAKANIIKESLIKQLKSKGADVEHLIDLINKYMWYWKQEQEMQKDIKKRGRTYTAISPSGKSYEKDNPSVKNALLFNKQQLLILEKLGLTAETVIKDDDDEL
jgi:hypothetical protein